PWNMAAIVHVMAAAFEHVENRAVEMTMLLAVGAGRIGLDVRLHGLDDAGRLRADHALAELPGTALPRRLLRRVDPLLLKERLVKMAVGPLQRPHEGAFFRPALPLFVLFLLGI